MGDTLGINTLVDRGSTFWGELAEAEDHVERAPAVRSTGLRPRRADPRRRDSVYRRQRIQRPFDRTHSHQRPAPAGRDVVLPASRLDTRATAGRTTSPIEWPCSLSMT